MNMIECGVVQLDEKAVNDFLSLRIQLFEELDELHEDNNIFELKAATKQYYLAHINKDLLSWGIYQNEKLVALGSLCLFTRIPHSENLSGLKGYVLNIYTYKLYRNHGFANQILDIMIAYCKVHGIKRLWLHNSEEGKRLYEQKGFKKKENEMELFLSF